MKDFMTRLGLLMSQLKRNEISASAAAEELEVLVAKARRHYAEQTSLLREVTLVMSCTGARRTLELMMDAVIRLSGAERGYILLARPDGSHEIAAARHMDRRTIEGASDEISQRVVRHVLSSGEPLRLEDAGATPPFDLAESVTRLRLLSVLCVPVRHEDSLIGALYLESRTLSGVFTEAHEQLIVEFASRVAGALRNAEAFDDLQRSRNRLRAALGSDYCFEGVVGTNPAFRELLRTVSIAATSDIPILIEGESGTGKELIARAVHAGSPRRDNALVSINCASLPQQLLESELFGHRRGAFTGAFNDRPGLFLSAHTGTLFLDEVGEMPPELQARLLRVLQSGELRPVGSDSVQRVDVRVVAATRRQMAEEVKQGRFREDLFFRLNGIHVRVPPLRERREDIPLLIRHFLERFVSEGEPPDLSPAARACLMTYDYPGNVRELETLMRRAILFARDGIINPEALPPDVRGAEGDLLRWSARVPMTGAELLAAKKASREAAAAELERAFLVQAMREANQRPGEAAKRARMNRSQFERMLARHGLTRGGAEKT